MLLFGIFLSVLFIHNINGFVSDLLPNTATVSVTNASTQQAENTLEVKVAAKGFTILLNVTRICNHGDKLPFYKIEKMKIRRHELAGKKCSVLYGDREKQAVLSIKPVGQYRYEVEGEFCHNNNAYTIKPNKKMPTSSSIAPYILAKGNRTHCKWEDKTKARNDRTKSHLENLRKRDVRSTLRRRSRRSKTLFTVELLMVVDYAAYRWWYGLSDASTDTERAAETMDRIWQYYGFIFQGMDLRFKTITRAPFEVNLSFSGLIVAKTEEESLWTHNVTMETDYGSVRSLVNSSEALQKFQAWTDETPDLPTFDHAMLFTGTNLTYAGNPGNTGLAFAESMCRNISNTSMVEDAFDFRTALYGTQQLARSLGASDDMDNNDCLEFFNFIMTPRTRLPISNFPTNRWRFSTCSVDYFRDYFDKLQQDELNCLGDTGSKGQLDKLTSVVQSLPGHVYTADQQCSNKFGPGSTICRTSIGDDYSRLCTGLYCTVPGGSGCDVILPGDGTPCGNQKYCKNGACSTFKDAIESLDICPFGDDPDAECDLSELEAFKCYNTTFRFTCCATCHNAVFGEPDCEYGDRKPSCTLRDCTTEDKVLRDVTCCYTCADGPTPYAPPGPDSMTTFPETSTQQLGTSNDPSTDVTAPSITKVKPADGVTIANDVTPIDYPYTDSTIYYDSLFDSTLPVNDYFYSTIGPPTFTTMTFDPVTEVSNTNTYVTPATSNDVSTAENLRPDTGATLVNKDDTVTSPPTDDPDPDPDGNLDSPLKTAVMTTSQLTTEYEGTLTTINPLIGQTNYNTVPDFSYDHVTGNALDTYTGPFGPYDSTSVVSKAPSVPTDMNTIEGHQNGGQSPDITGSGVDAVLTTVFPQEKTSIAAPSAGEQEEGGATTTSVTLKTIGSTKVSTKSALEKETDEDTTVGPSSSTTISNTSLKTNMVAEVDPETPTKDANGEEIALTPSGGDASHVTSPVVFEADHVTVTSRNTISSHHVTQEKGIGDTTQALSVSNQSYTREEARYLRQLYQLLMYEHRHVKYNFKMDILHMRSELARFMAMYQGGSGTRGTNNFPSPSGDTGPSNTLTRTWNQERNRIHLDLDYAIRRLRYRSFIKVRRYLIRECISQGFTTHPRHPRPLTCGRTKGARWYFTGSGRRLLSRLYQAMKKQQRVIHRGTDLDLYSLKVKINKLIHQYLDLDGSSSDKGSNSFSSPDDDDLCTMIARTFHRELLRLEANLDYRVRELRYRILSLVHHYIRAD